MQFTSEQRLDDGVLEREFALGEIPGALSRSTADEQARVDLRRAMQAGGPVDEIYESFIGPPVEKAVPDWGAGSWTDT